MVKIKMNLEDLDNNEGSGGLEIEIPETIAPSYHSYKAICKTEDCSEHISTSKTVRK
jgi:hypothetical protein